MSFNLKEYKCLGFSVLFHGVIISTLLIFSIKNNSAENFEMNINSQGSQYINVQFTQVTKEKTKEDPIIKNPIIDEEGELKKIKEKKLEKEEKNNQVTKQNLGVTGESDDDSNAKTVIEDQSLLQVKAPTYPKRALVAKQEGEVIVRMLVDKAGQIKKIVIHKSSNYPLLDKAVLEVAERWDIKRSLKEDSWIQVKVNFVIK